MIRLNNIKNKIRTKKSYLLRFKYLVKKELIRIYQDQLGKQMLIPSRTKSYHDIKVTPKWLLPVTFQSVMIYLMSFWCYREVFS